MRFVLLLWALSAFSFGQAFYGSARGSIADPNGAGVAGATITIVDEATQASRTTISNSAGEYVFSSLTPATYSFTVELTGFKRSVRTGINVATQTAVTVNFDLALGEVTEQINVTEESPRLETADASAGQVLDRQKLVDLPILGRNPFLAARLAQSVAFVGNPRFARMQDQNANSQVSISGGPPRSNNYLVDGISITDSTNRAVIVPSPEAVQELKLQATTFDAEVGRTGGGVFNTLIKSGTNELHGSAVGHIRQTDWLANGFFANRAGQQIADQPFRDWGASIGGPVFIPKFYDGRNRTFFFLGTEAYRQKDGSTTQLAIPTAHERAGNFSQSLNRAGNLQTIYDPLTTTAAGVRTPFAGNIIPQSRINSVGAAIVSYFPQASGQTAYHGAPNYTVTGSYPNRGDQYLAKADHQFAPWLRASGSYIFQKSFETSAPNLFNNAASPSQNYCCDRKIDATQANAILTPDATTVVALRWGFNRFYTRSTQASSGFNLSDLGLPASLVAATPNPAFPVITLGEISSFGGGTTTQDVFYSRAFSATVSKFLGNHSLKGGFEYRTIANEGTPASGPSSFGFTDAFTRPNPLSTTTGQGSTLASLLLGYPTSGSQTVVTKFDNYLRYFGGFVHDDYRVNSKLILNFGVRFEHETGIRDRNNQIVTGFDATAANPLQANVPNLALPGVVQFAGTNGVRNYTGNPLAVKFSPRFGFAYTIDPKTVLRGGYGIFWAPTYFTFQNAIGYSQTTDLIASTDGNFTPAASLSNPYPNGLLQPTGSSLGGLTGIGQPISIYDPSSRSAGYVQQFSLEVQRQLPAGFVLTVGALGSRGIGLLNWGQNINQLNPSLLGEGNRLVEQVANPLFGNGGVGTVGTRNISRSQLLRPFPQYTSVTLANSDTGSSRYYSTYFRGERRFANGLSVLASYTWSRSTDDRFGYSGAGTSQVTALTAPQNSYDLPSEWSLSTQDIRNRFTSALTYELPVGKGRQFLSNNTALDLLVGGWSVNAVVIAQSGFPLSITQPNNNSVIGTSLQRPNATGENPETSGSTSERIDSWLNRGAFSQAAQFTFGNVSRFISARGPSTRNLDLSVFKTFRIGELAQAQFRAEALNATNTPVFGRPNTVFTNAQFGLITSQANNPRLVQLGVRVTF